MTRAESRDNPLFGCGPEEFDAIAERLLAMNPNEVLRVSVEDLKTGERVSWETIVNPQRLNGFRDHAGRFYPRYGPPGQPADPKWADRLSSAQLARVAIGRALLGPAPQTKKRYRSYFDEACGEVLGLLDSYSPDSWREVRHNAFERYVAGEGLRVVDREKHRRLFNRAYDRHMKRRSLDRRTLKILERPRSGPQKSKN